jgi:uncharacterized membrane protein
MTKKTFLKKLETKLSHLDEAKRTEIINKYERIIDKEVGEGKDIKDVIASLGSVDMIAKLYDDVETKHDEKPKEEKENTSKNEKTASNNVLDNIIKYIDDTFKNIDDQLAKRILLILCFVFIGIVGLSLLHIPFRIIDVIGTGFFNLLFDDYYYFHFVSSFWSISLGICYAILVIWLVFHYVNKIVYRYSDKDYRAHEASKVNVESEKVEDRKEVRDTSKDNSLLDILYVLLKVFIIIMTIPFLMMEVGLVIALFCIIALIVKGVVLIGPMVFLIGFISLVGTLLDLVYTSISKGGIR